MRGRRCRRSAKTGSVLDEDLVRKGADAHDKLEALAQVVSTQMRGALAEAIPIVTQLAQWLAEAARWAGRFVDSFRECDPQQLSTRQATQSGLKPTRARS